jgi:O-antigen biosynthesis protein
MSREQHGVTSIGVSITGMHRSGTSLTASWFESCGLPISAGRVIGPDIGNPHGHFEDLDFYRLQRRALLRSPGSWRVTRAAPLAFNDEELAEARMLVEARIAEFPKWGWKDPRSLLYFREWKRLHPPLKAFIVWRPCVEVVRSLTARAAARHFRPATFVDPLTAARMWRAHNQVALSLLRDFPRDVILVSVRALVAHDRAVIERCNAQWGLGLVHSSISEVRDDALLQVERTVPSRVAAWLVGASALERELAAASIIAE